MFDTVILLTGAAERAVFPELLRGHNPRLAVIPVETSAELAALSQDLLRRARLIAYVTPVIVPQRILARLGYGAFNFHPGPPNYPGWAPAHFALYHQATEFGVTLHVMVERVDAGPIIEFEMFAIPDDISVLGLEGLAYAHLAHLFWRGEIVCRRSGTAANAADQMGSQEILPQHLSRDVRDFPRPSQG